MPKIIPLRELKNASKISEMCHENDEPIFVTKNGVSDLVILTSNKYDQMNSNNEYSFEMQTNKVSQPGLLEYMSERDDKKPYTIVELKQTLSPIFKKYKVKKAILFGSYVKGTADTRSDVDLVVETNLKGWDFYGFLGEISDILRFPVDLIEKRTIIKGSNLEKEINNTGVTIYG